MLVVPGLMVYYCCLEDPIKDQKFLAKKHLKVSTLKLKPFPLEILLNNVIFILRPGYFWGLTYQWFLVFMDNANFALWYLFDFFFSFFHNDLILKRLLNRLLT